MKFDPNSVSQGTSVPSPILLQPDIPGELAILPLEGVVVFPLMIAPIVLSEDRAKQVIESVMKTDRMVALFHPMDQPDAPEIENGKNGAAETTPRLFETGTLCSVLRMLRIPDGSLRLLLHGICRVKLEEILTTEPFIRGRVKVAEDKEPKAGDPEVEAMMKLTLENLQRAISLSAMSEELAVAAMNVEGPGKMADLVASNLPVKPTDMLSILEEADTKSRLRKTQSLLGREVHMLEIGSRINDEVREEVDRGQRSFFLNQQLKAIRRELGETDPHEAELDALAARIKEAMMPDHARKVAEKELHRLQGMPTAAAEYGVIRTYLEWILDIPWNTSSNDHIDIDKARMVLDEDHYGLEQVKERILEFLSVIRLKKGNLKGPILCLTGPPGVGKTSLGRSVARATGRKFQNFSLGGMRDEAEIRGHRRTYVGSMPGRIIKCLKDAGTNNPLIMLDEIDKLGSDFRGDPASALLEVLDPEQNFHFTDHYMDMPVDLSKVMFITTANTIDAIPEPLRDRMEIIRIAGYTDLEKQEIATRYLVPREKENSGLRSKDIQFTKPALKKIIHEYTAEAGVRGLQREINKVCRKVAMTVAEYQSAEERKEPLSEKKKGPRKATKPTSLKREKPTKVTITPENLEKYLGQKKSFQEVAERMGRPGVSIGLAWTQVGGAILFIEAARYPGDGALKLTGQLGEVMKESAQAALTYLKSNHTEFKLEAEDFKKFEYHVHVPAGATPKDGPSAGVAIATALASLMSGRPTKDYVAMTGEITLRGSVMPVGGIKEKCLAAHRAGIRNVLLPKHNEADFSEVPETIRKAMNVSFFDNAKQYIHASLK
ncbi:endopeptidase La [Candidatus Sumerlaeota bacterium]|nr:endopeptidase La [Candidatus Sumerlaeota bacterium]